MGGEEILLDIRVSVCYILEHLDVGKRDLFIFIALGCGITLIFKLHGRTRRKIELRHTRVIHTNRSRFPIFKVLIIHKKYVGSGPIITRS